jgi:hypothetical protein
LIHSRFIALRYFKAVHHALKIHSSLNKGNKMKNTFAIILAGAALGFCLPAMAATPEAKAAYSASNDKAAADYKTDRTQCDAITGNPRDICIATANAIRVQTEQMAQAQYDGTASAQSSARMKIADANFDLDKTKCASQNGNAKDVCVKQAKAIMIAAQANATADKKVVDARADANADKRSANYKVALEKCDGLAGPGKDSCIASAKTQYGQ